MELPSNIFELIQHGDRSALEQLFKAYYQGLCGYANTFLKDIDEAEDVVQEMFFQLWEKREKLSVETSIKSYLYRSVHNACLNKIKHLKIVQEHQQHTIASTELFSGDNDGNQYIELEQRVAKAINELPAERRKIYELSRDEGLKYKEIAERLNISVKTVENQMGSALKFLRENLKDLLPMIVLLIVLKIFK